MFLSERLRVRVSEGKKSEHPLRCNERHTQPRPQMRKTREGRPFSLLRRLRDEEAILGNQNVHQKPAVPCIKGLRRLGRMTIRPAKLYFPRKEKAGVRFH